MRRHFPTWAFLLLAGLTSATAWARRPAYPPVELQAPAHGERLQLRPFDDKGRPRRNARGELSRILRCPHTGEVRAADARLMPALYRLGRHFGRPLVITSGYRPKRFSTRPRSRHLTAAAVDFHVLGVKNLEVVRWLRRELHPVGVGYYPQGQHIHLDVDRRWDTFWVQRGSDALPLAGRLSRRGNRS